MENVKIRWFLQYFRAQGGIKMDIFGVEGRQGEAPRHPQDAPKELLERIGLDIKNLIASG